VHPLLAIFRLRRHSFPRAVLISLTAFAASMLLAGFPYIENLHGSYWQWAVLALALLGMADTARCLQRKWSLYHAGVLITLYTNLMILALILFLAIYQ
jgi:hypothetical protein